MKLLSAFSEMMIPLLIFYIVLTGICGKKRVYEDFIRGAKEGLLLVFRIMPTMIALMIAVGVLRASGFLEFVAEFLAPAAKWLHLPAPLVPLAVVKTFSGSAATGLLLDLFKEYGADSMIGKIGSLMLSSTETIFYTLSLYFVSSGIKKTRYTIPGCLLATFAGILGSVLFAKLM